MAVGEAEQPPGRWGPRAVRGDDVAKQGIVSGGRVGTRIRSRSGGKLVLLSNAIECFLLLATSERRLSSRTVQLYKVSLAHLEIFAHEHGHTRIMDLTPNLLRAAAAAEMNATPSPSIPRSHNWRGGEGMAVAVIAATRCMLRRLQEEFPELALPDISMVKTPRMPKRIQPRLQDGEFALLESTLRLRLLRDRVPRFLIARDLAILALLGNTGLRANECSSLDVSDVDLKEGVIRVRSGKGNKWRILTVRDPDPAERDGGEVVRGLGDYLIWRARWLTHVDTPALWVTLRGNRLNPTELRRMLSELCQEAGIDGNRPPHAFRRAYFTEQYRDQPSSLPVLVERMGWESDQMVKVYTRGVDVELARRIALPLMTKKWRGDGQNVRSFSSLPRPNLNTGVGFRGKTNDDPALAHLSGTDEERGRLVHSRGSRRLKG